LISGTPTTPGTTIFTATVTDFTGATCTDVVTIVIGVGYYNLILCAYYGGNNTPIDETGNSCISLPSPVSSGYAITVHLSGNATAFGGGWIRVTGNLGAPGGPAFDTGQIVVPSGVDSGQPVTWTAP
jgi:hypothetical protein